MCNCRRVQARYTLKMAWLKLEFIMSRSCPEQDVSKLADPSMQKSSPAWGNSPSPPGATLTIAHLHRTTRLKLIIGPFQYMDTAAQRLPAVEALVTLSAVH